MAIFELKIHKRTAYWWEQLPRYTMHVLSTVLHTLNTILILCNLLQLNWLSLAYILNALVRGGDSWDLWRLLQKFSIHNIVACLFEGNELCFSPEQHCYIYLDAMDGWMDGCMYARCMYVVMQLMLNEATLMFMFHIYSF